MNLNKLANEPHWHCLPQGQAREMVQRAWHEAQRPARKQPVVEKDAPNGNAANNDAEKAPDTEAAVGGLGA